MKTIILTITLIFIQLPLFAQIPGDKKVNDNGIFYSCNINHSLGYAFDKGEPVFYVSVSKFFNRKFGIGIKGGIYDYALKTDQAFVDFITPYFISHTPGVYEISGPLADVPGIIYIGALNFSYSFLNKFFVDLSPGLKIFNQKSYNGTIRFSKSYQGQAPPKPEELTLGNIKATDSATKMKLYISAGVNYRFGRFSLGLFGDNVYSAGISFGLFF